MDIAKQIYRPWKLATSSNEIISNHILEAKNGKKWVLYRQVMTHTTAYSKLISDNNYETRDVQQSCKYADDRLWNSHFDMNYADYSPNDTEKYNEVVNY